MAQRQIILNAYPLKECGPNHFCIAMDLGKTSPSKRVAIDTVPDCKAALAAFAEELIAPGQPWHLSVSIARQSGRKPAGFDKARTARELECHVNAHLAPPRAA